MFYIWSQYYESLLQEAREETEREISEAVERAVAAKVQKMQAKLDVCLREQKFLDDVIFSFLVFSLSLLNFML